MRRFLASPELLLLLGLLLSVSVAMSSVPGLWFVSIVAFVAALAAVGWQLAPPALAWVIAINMLSIWADIARIELNNAGWTFAVIESNLPVAIVNSSWAMAFLAVGMRVGMAIGWPVFRFRLSAQQTQSANGAPYTAHRITLGYAAFLPASVVFGIIGHVVPGLSQPAHVFGLLKFVLIYMLAASVFATGRGAYLLIGVILTEVVIGSTGYFSGYKEGFFTVLIALAASARRFSFKQVGLALAGIAAMIYISLAWTAVKQEYRSSIVSGDSVANVTWLADKYFGGELNFGEAAIDLLDRVGYTKFYAMIIDANTASLQGIYERALLHIVTPRVLFPDKPVLDDSAETAAALGWSISQGTSIGIGYVAQAHIDFGFPGLLAPMVMLGALIGLMYAYFLTRPAPLLMREAFAVAGLFNALVFAGNIDKQIGGMIISFIVMAVALRFGGPILHRWLSVASQAMPDGRSRRHGLRSKLFGPK